MSQMSLNQPDRGISSLVCSLMLILFFMPLKHCIFRCFTVNFVFKFSPIMHLFLCSSMSRMEG